jgi:hypothetical protein
MRDYLETLLSEKGIDIETPIEVEGESGTNFMSVKIVVEAICSTTKQEQDKIKDTIVIIDFKNGDLMHYFNHLAKAIAI